MSQHTTDRTGFRVQVVGRRREAERIISLELAATEDGEPLPRYEPGSHIDVNIGGFMRQYSLCGDPGAPSWRIAVLEEPQSRGGSRAIHEQTPIGTILQVGMPRNLFRLDESAPAILVAGGIGITPILAMARALAAAGKAFELHYCAKRPEVMAFHDELKSGNFSDAVQFYFSDEGVNSRPFDAMNILRDSPPDARLYICGPTGFIDYVQSAAQTIGWATDRIHRESFAAVSEQNGRCFFQIRLLSDGRLLDVEEGMTALQVLLDAGVDVPYSCESGICGSCLTTVVEGVPDHRDQFMTDAERARNDQFTPCCSRAHTPQLVLSL
ncbi:PDR/VanB family oxidoreductase [Ottowia sp. VDI28]|uniref:PDR/VanB family oxidoreductase n=1 Tax=Ottowia sp. VDI28 TaxID=3133968 RepID=UPI003C2D1516